MTTAEPETVPIDPIQERYLHWKSNTPKLYNHLHTQNTIWPSLQVKFLPDLEHSITPGIHSFRLLTTLHSSGQKDVDFIRINRYSSNTLSSRNSSFDEDSKRKIELDQYDQDLQEFKDVSGDVMNKFTTLQNLKVPVQEGDINVIDYLPQNSNLISFGCGNGGVYIIDKTKHASNLEMTEELNNGTPFYCTKLSGHEGEVTGMSWNYQTMARLITSSTKGDINLSDITQYNPSQDQLEPLQSFQSDPNGVNSLEWIPSHDSIFITANESNFVRIFDTRTSDNSMESSSSYHENGINCLSVNKQNSFILSTGDGAGNIMVWDIRSLSEPIKKLSSVHIDSITCLEFNPLEPTTVASGSLDSTVQLYNLGKEDGEELTFRHGGHLLGVNDIAWSLHHKDLIASVANDNTLQLWSAH